MYILADITVIGLSLFSFYHTHTAGFPPHHPASAEAYAGVVQVSAGKVSSAAAPQKYKKAPDAPKRFKSAFIIFSAEKHKEIKEDLAKKGRSEKVSSLRTAV